MRENILISTIPQIDELLVPTIMQVLKAHPEIRVTLRSELGFADLSDGMTIAIRTGEEPECHGLRCTWLGRLAISLVATAEYITRHGKPDSVADLPRFPLAGYDPQLADPPWYRWLRARGVAADPVFVTSDAWKLRMALKSGHCAGFIPISGLAWSPVLREVMEGDEAWSVPLWLVHDRQARQLCCDFAQALAERLRRQLG